jgi:hypothetical protein
MSDSCKRSIEAYMQELGVLDIHRETEQRLPEYARLAVMGASELMGLADRLTPDKADESIRETAGCKMSDSRA